MGTSCMILTISVKPCWLPFNSNTLPLSPFQTTNMQHRARRELPASGRGGLQWDRIHVHHHGATRAHPPRPKSTRGTWITEHFTITGGVLQDQAVNNLGEVRSPPKPLPGWCRTAPKLLWSAPTDWWANGVILQTWSTHFCRILLSSV